MKKTQKASYLLCRVNCSPFCKKLNQIREILRVAARMTRQHQLLIKNSRLEKYSELYAIYSESSFVCSKLTQTTEKNYLGEYVTGALLLETYPKRHVGQAETRTTDRQASVDVSGSRTLALGHSAEADTRQTPERLPSLNCIILLW